MTIEAIYTSKGAQRTENLDPTKIYQFALTGCNGYVQTSKGPRPSDNVLTQRAEYAKIKWEVPENTAQVGHQAVVTGVTMLRCYVEEFLPETIMARLLLVEIHQNGTPKA